MPSWSDVSTVASHSRKVASVSSSLMLPTPGRLCNRGDGQGVSMPLVLLRGGSRDGESTTLDEHVERLYAASAAPGMVDIYEATDSLATVRGNDEQAVVYEFVDQEPIGDTTATHLH